MHDTTSWQFILTTKQIPPIPPFPEITLKSKLLFTGIAIPFEFKAKELK